MVAKMPNKNLEFWQINLQHCKAASDSLISDVGSNLQTLPILLIQEPYVRKGHPIFNLTNYNTFYKGKNNRSLISVPRLYKSWPVESLTDSDNVTVLIEDDKNKQILLVSSYLDITNGNVIPNKLEEILNYSNIKKIPVLLGMDSNSHSTFWGCDSNNSRGDKLEEWILQNNLAVVNRGYEKTFVSPIGSSIIDLTLVSNEILGLVKCWTVDPTYQLSDHKKLVYHLDFNNTLDIWTRNLKAKDWKIKFRIFDSIKDQYEMEQQLSKQDRYVRLNKKWEPLHELFSTT